MSKPPLFSDAEREMIRVAVAEAETRTSGEIVPYVVRQSGDYPVAVWRAASVVALGAGVAALAVAWLYDGWGLGWLYSAWALALVMTLGGVAGAAATLAGPVRRLFAGADELDTTVHRRSAVAFIEEEVFDTRDRTGILLFVSLFEHRIEVVGDAGINARVEQEEWVEIVDRIRDGIRERSLAAGLVAAVARCGDLLERRGVALREDDTDELSDDVRVRDE
ncbi:TPM domain-containing protein [Rubrivirga sp. IMCC43871]|uniref:TPM domain-containing protein n=1 Tax=Rubrivirga sp. IMCC43871 TaxID=3391575 RepID=UPI00398FD8E0